MDNPYEWLNAQPDMSHDEIKVRYRALAQKWHPDKPDGDAEVFSKLAEAWEILRDPDKRAQFDELGHVDSGPPTPEQQAVNHLMSLFLNVAGQMQFQPGSYIKTMRQIVTQDRDQGHQTISKTKRLLARIDTAAPSTDDDENIFAGVLRQQAEGMTRDIEDAEGRLQMLGAALEILKRYRDDMIVDPSQRMTFDTGTGTGSIS